MRKPTKNKSGHIEEAPKLKSTDPVVLELWVKSGGRCAFHGCNRYLLQDELTTNKAKLANIAHIVARRINGPRGKDPLPIEKRNEIDNLILLCTKCHTLIDKKEFQDIYSKEILLKYKKEHENRIRYITGLDSDSETVIIRMFNNIRGDSVTISNEEIRIAVLKGSERYPRYLGGENNIEINLTGLPQKISKTYWDAGKGKIDEIVGRLINPAIDKKEIKHLSVFAISRIPLLIYLGYKIGDKVPIDNYQKHRDGDEGWAWRDDSQTVTFKSSTIQQGSDNLKIAIILSVSGKISIDQLPSEITCAFTIAEISPENAPPNRNLLKNKCTLQSFRDVYEGLLRQIEKDYKKVKNIHIFPAIPAPVAIVCGRELLKEVSPSLLIYDRIDDEYKFTIGMN
ncbi:MAG: SAVED domain-containing protein [Candidatus Lokiarchaeota archaeon]|nr:SAVED domain-containing protein [Candidatus Lokiarchaeota archaeon]